MKKFKVTFEVEFPDGTRPHPVYIQKASDELDAEKQAKHYWIEERSLCIGRCLSVEAL
jgi:hypothetical protein